MKSDADNINYSKLPVLLQPGVKRYIDYGDLPGDFLRAVIKNDLLDAVCRVSPRNRPFLKDIVMFFHWEAPGACWRSAEKMLAWKEKGGLKGTQ